MADQTKIEAIYEIRIEQGPALRELEQTRKRLDENAFAKAALVKQTKQLLAEQQRLAATIAKEGDATGQLSRELKANGEALAENNRKVTEADALNKRLAGVYREQVNDVSGLTEAHLRFRDKMADANLEALKQSGILGQIGAQERNLKEELQGVNAGIEKNQAAITELNVAWKKGAVTEEEYKRQLDAINKELDEGKAKNATLAKELEGVTAKSAKLEQQLKELNAEFKAGKISQEQYQKGLKDIDNSTKGLGEKFDKFVSGQGAELKSTLSSVALQYVGVGAAIYGVQRALGATIDTIVDFDQELANVRALGGEFKKDIDRIGQAAIELGPKFGVAPVEALKAFEALAKAGVSAGDILSGGLEGALQLSAAGTLDVAQAAEIASASMNQFGLAGSDVTHIADLLAAGANKAAGEVSDFGAALKFVGPVAAANNVALEETVGTIALFAQSGVIGEQAGTSLRGVLSSLTSPSKAATEELKKLGIVAEDGSSKLFDAQGNFKGLANLAGTLQEATAGLTQEQKDYSLGLIFGNQQLTAANILVKSGAKGIEDYTRAVNDSGFANDVAAEKLNSIAGEVDKTSAAWEAFVLSLSKGDSAIGNVLRNVLSGVTGILEALGPGSELDRSVAAFTERTQKEFESLGGVGLLSAEKGDPLVDSFRQKTEAAKKYGNTIEDIGLIEAARNLVLRDSNALQNKFDAARRQGGEKLTEQELVQLAAAQASVAALGEELDKRRKQNIAIKEGNETRKAANERLKEELATAKQALDNVTVADTQGKKLADENIARIQGEIDALNGQGKAIETVASKREALNLALENAKKDRDALNASDTEALTKANAEVDSLEAQIKGLDGKTTGTKKLNEADKERTEILAELTKAEEDRAKASAIDVETRAIRKTDQTISEPQAKALATAKVEKDARVEQAKGDAALLIRIEAEYQQQVLDIRNRFGAQQVEQQDQLDSLVLSKQAEGNERRLSALLDQQQRELDTFRGSKDELRALLESQAAARAPLLQAQQDEAIRVLTESAEKEFAVLDEQGISTVALQDELGKAIADIKAKYREQELTDEEAQTLALKDIQQRRQEETLGVIEGFLVQAQQISDLAFDSKIAKIDDENAVLRDQIANTSNETLKAQLEGDLKAGEAEKKRLEDKKKAFKAFAIGAALIETYLNATKAYGSQLVPGDPTSLPRAIAAAIQATLAGLVNVAQIKGFVQGGDLGEVNGVVNSSWGRPIRRSNGDNVLVRTKGGGAVTLQTEEMVLSRKSRAMMEERFGPGIWGAVGVPGYAAKQMDIAREFRLSLTPGFVDGGRVTRGTALVNAAAPRPSSSDLVSGRLAAALEAYAQRPVYTSITEFREVEGKVNFQERSTEA